MKITQWSFSRLTDYRKCPRMAKYKHVDRLKEPGNAAMQRGSDIHTMAEQFSKANKRARAPVELKLFEKQFRELQGQNIITEEKWALTRKWAPTDFFNKDVWVRLVLDCAVVEEENGTVIDYKTGKPYEHNKESLKLYGLGMFMYYPVLEHVKAALWYLDNGQTTEVEFKRAEVPSLKKYWEKETKRLLADEQFEPTPGNACRWCYFRRSNGGPCEHG